MTKNTSTMAGFLHEGPRGPRMSEGQLCAVTRAIGSALQDARSEGRKVSEEGAREMLAALDAYPVDRSCWTCRNFQPAADKGAPWGSPPPGPKKDGEARCATFQRVVSEEHREAGQGTDSPCPEYLDAAICYIEGLVS